MGICLRGSGRRLTEATAAHNAHRVATLPEPKIWTDGASLSFVPRRGTFLYTRRRGTNAAYGAPTDSTAAPAHCDALSNKNDCDRRPTYAMHCKPPLAQLDPTSLYWYLLLKRRNRGIRCSNDKQMRRLSNKPTESPRGSSRPHG